MANKNFRVRNGLEIGDTVAITGAGAVTGVSTITDATTIDTTNLEVSQIRAKDGTSAMTLLNTSGTVMVLRRLDVVDISIDDNTISSINSSSNINITPQGAGSVVISKIDANSGTIDNTIIGGSTAAAGTFTTATATTGNITTVNSTTLDTTNLEVTNIKAKDGTAAMTIADTTGVVAITTADVTNLDVTNIRALDGTAAATVANSTGIITVSTELNVDNINISGNTISSTDTNGDILITPNGTGDVDLVTDTVVVGDTNATATITTNGTGDLVLNTNAGTNAGNITLTNGVNGNITATTNGTGNIQLNTNDGGNVVASRNFVDGAIRNANTQARGNIWELLATTPPTAPTGPVSGVSVDNSLDTTKTAGLVIRNYGAAAPSRGRFIFERSRGTAVSPSAVLVGDFLGEVGATGFTTAGWINDLTANMPGFFGVGATENWTGTSNVGTGLTISLQPTATTLATGSQVPCLAINPQSSLSRSDAFTWASGKTTGFVATGCSTSGTTLNIGTVTSGTVAIGQVVQTATLALPVGVFIVSGSGTTWTLSASVTTLSGQTVTGLAGHISTNTNSTTILNDFRLFRNTVNNFSNTPQITLTNNRSNLTLTGDTITAETVSGTDLLVLTPANTVISSDVISLKNQAAAALTGNKIDYSRVYGQWEQDGPITPVAADTSYVFPIGTAIDTNVATVGSTSRIIPGAAGKYNLQFSLQWANADNAEHTFYVWLRKNGANVANSAGDVTCLKSAKGVTGWNYIVSSANATDYWELAYQVNNTSITFPYVAAQGTAPNDIPAAPALITTLTPVGA
jgi:hypothetical protein